ncbi:hypothetical protein HDU67_008063 [Dinochytrium kinnereticum]|nr:hypothetical protein HDU67_008063 [Dinochytrium kinnereticum]
MASTEKRHRLLFEKLLNVRRLDGVGVEAGAAAVEEVAGAESGAGAVQVEEVTGGEEREERSPGTVRSWESFVTAMNDEGDVVEVKEDNASGGEKVPTLVEAEMMEKLDLAPSSSTNPSVRTMLMSYLKFICTGELPAPGPDTIIVSGCEREPTFFCEICREDGIPMDKAFTVSPCSHHLCRPCAHDVIMAAVTSRQFPLLCPICVANRATTPLPPPRSVQQNPDLVEVVSGGMKHDPECDHETAAAVKIVKSGSWSWRFGRGLKGRRSTGQLRLEGGGEEEVGPGSSEQSRWTLKRFASLPNRGRVGRKEGEGDDTVGWKGVGKRASVFGLFGVVEKDLEQNLEEATQEEEGGGAVEIPFELALQVLDDTEKSMGEDSASKP